MGRPKKQAAVQLVLESFEGTRMQRMQALYEKWMGCTRCRLCEFRRKDDGQEDPEIVFGDGDADTARILVVGEAPGEDEERSKVPFTGKSGQLLQQILAYTADDTGVQKSLEVYSKKAHTEARVREFHEMVSQWRKHDFFITNAVACRPPENRAPLNDEVKACWERLYNIIYIIDPHVIIAVGKTAIEALVGRGVQITEVRGRVHEITIPGRVGDVPYTTIPVLHPAWLLRKADWNAQDGDYVKTVADVYSALRIFDVRRADYYQNPVAIPARMGARE